MEQLVKLSFLVLLILPSTFGPGVKGERNSHPQKHLSALRRHGRSILQSPPPSPPPESISNGVLVISTIKFSGANFTALAAVEQDFVTFQTNFKNQMIASAQSTGYKGGLQVSIDSVQAGSIVVGSTTWFLDASTYTLPEAFAENLRDNVATVFASSNYFLELPSGQIISSNVTTSAAESDGSSKSGSSSKKIPWIVWLLIGITILLIAGIALLIYFKYSSWKEEPDYQQQIEDNDENYDPQTAYAQLVAEAQGYERTHPTKNKRNAGNGEKVSMPAIPNPGDNEFHPYLSQMQPPPLPVVPPPTKPVSAPRRIWRAISGPVLFTSGPQQSPSQGDLLPEVQTSAALPNQTPPGGAPRRVKNLLRSISGPVRFVFLGEPTGQRVNQVNSGSWSGRLSGVLSRSTSKIYKEHINESSPTQEDELQGPGSHSGRLFSTPPRGKMFRSASERTFSTELSAMNNVPYSKTPSPSSMLNGNNTNSPLDFPKSSSLLPSGSLRYPQSARKSAPLIFLNTVDSPGPLPTIDQSPEEKDDNNTSIFRDPESGRPGNEAVPAPLSKPEKPHQFQTIPTLPSRHVGMSGPLGMVGVDMVTDMPLHRNTSGPVLFT